MPYVVKHSFALLCSICLLGMPVQAASAARQNTAPPKTIQAKPPAVGQKMSGMSAWYGLRAHGNRTASGTTFDSTKLTAAHRTLPFGTMVKVTNKKNKKSVVVQITDRGPTAKKYIIDISRQAAIDIGMLKQGVADVILEIMSLPSSRMARR